jgi:hypothetical protein
MNWVPVESSVSEWAPDPKQGRIIDRQREGRTNNLSLAPQAR